ncbi:MAG: hypothetical protein KCHDKBKB_00782 [Elusimicrobia bacterium]|nr:hypothetical protein [Elusimicrobiota bacterium]
MALYLFANGTRPFGATPFAAVTTGTSTKTMLQIKSSQTGQAGGANGMSSIKVREWGISFDGSAAATPIKCELIEMAAPSTVTAANAQDIIKFDNYYSPDPALTLGTSATGYSSSSENAGEGGRIFDVQFVAPTNQYIKQFPLGQEPQVFALHYLKIRVTAGTAVNAYCYILFEM